MAGYFKIHQAVSGGHLKNKLFIIYYSNVSGKMSKIMEKSGNLIRKKVTTLDRSGGGIKLGLRDGVSQLLGTEGKVYQGKRWDGSGHLPTWLCTGDTSLGNGVVCHLSTWPAEWVTTWSVGLGGHRTGPVTYPSGGGGGGEDGTDVPSSWTEGRTGWKHHLSLVLWTWSVIIRRILQQ